MAGRGEVAEDIDTEHPLAKLIKAAFQASEPRPNVIGKGNVESEADLRQQPWFKRFADQLDHAIAQTREALRRQLAGFNST
jgi:hypothetical protein